MALFHYFLIILISCTLLAQAMSFFNSLMSKEDKPTCKTSEACALNVGGLSLPLPCSCGENSRCISRSPSDIKDDDNQKKYKFCEQSENLPQCTLNQIALEVEGYRHFFHCSCPNQFDLVSHSWDPKLDRTTYSCSKLNECEEDEICQRKIKISKPKPVSNLRSMCRCTENRACNTLKSYCNRTVEVAEWVCGK